MKNNKGITIIALIITIIIMLILVGVVIDVSIDGNLFDKAQTAVNKTNEKVSQTQSRVDELMGKLKNVEQNQCNHIYVDGVCTLCGKEKEPINPGERAKGNSKYIDGGKIAIVPDGFTVSGNSNEKNINDGLVIYDIPTSGANAMTDAEIKNIDWTADLEMLKTTYNQFVWIPVDFEKTAGATCETDENFKSIWKTSGWVQNNSTGGDKTTLDQAYTEPYSYNQMDYDGPSGTNLKAYLDEMRASVYKYGGFYIGRYEAGYEYKVNGQLVPRTGLNDPAGNVVLRQDYYPYNFVSWGTSMSNIGQANVDGSLPATIGAVYLSKNMTLECGCTTATTMLCSGTAWDVMLTFLKDSNHIVYNDSKSWGNYKNAYNYDITRGWYSLNDGATYTQISTLTDKKYTKSSSTTSVLLTTGASERNSYKNIYDIAGNCKEWTTEAKENNRRVTRGGYFSSNGSSSPAAYRAADDPGVLGYANWGFRPTLYINV